MAQTFVGFPDSVAVSSDSAHLSIQAGAIADMMAVWGWSATQAVATLIATHDSGTVDTLIADTSAAMDAVHAGDLPALATLAAQHPASTSIPAGLTDACVGIEAAVSELLLARRVETVHAAETLLQGAAS